MANLNTEPIRVNLDMAAFNAKAEELRALITEANGLLRDIRTERRAVDTARREVKANIETWVSEQCGALFKSEIDQVTATSKRAMETAVDVIMAEFDKLTNMLFTGTEDGSGPDLREQVAGRMRMERAAKAIHRRNLA